MQVLGCQVSPSRALSPEIPRTSLGQGPQRPAACLPRRNTTSGLSAPIRAVGEHATRSTPKRTRCRLGLAAQCSPSERACNLKERETVTRHGLWRGGSRPREAPSCPSSEDGCPPTWVRPPESGGARTQRRARGYSLPDDFVEALPVLRRGVPATGHLEQSVGNGLVVELFHRQTPWRPKSAPAGAPRTGTNREKEHEDHTPRLCPKVPRCSAPPPANAVPSTRGSRRPRAAPPSGSRGAAR